MSLSIASIQPEKHVTPILETSATPRPMANRAQTNSSTQPFHARYHTSISEIPRADWDQLFHAEAEGWDYFHAIEQTVSPAFRYAAIGVYTSSDCSELVAASPVFHIDYRLDTSLDARIKSITDWISKTFPSAFRLPVIGLGSPMTEECPIGFADHLSPTECDLALCQILAALNQSALDCGARVLALKDITDADAGMMNKTFSKAGFARMASLPVATLPLPYDSVDGYLAALPAKVRTDLRRKMRLAKHVTTEFRDNIEDIHDELVALYQETRANRKASYEAFDEIPEGYFDQTLKNCRNARVMLCRVDGKIASFNLFLEEEDRIIGKFIGMRYDIARKHNLYFVNWMKMVSYCIENGKTELQTGQTTYQLKIRLGCVLKKSWVYFRHTNNVVNLVFRTAGPSMGLDKADPDLKVLGDKARYQSTQAA